MTIQSVRARAGAIVLAAVMGLSLATAPAHATTTQEALPPEIVQQYIEVFEHHGVDPAVWDSLLAKIEAGELPDADLGNVKPVSSTRAVVDRKPVVRNVYPDGSVSLSTAPLAPTSLVTTPGSTTVLGSTVTECSIRTVSGYTYRDNCRVVYDGISFSYSFRANFRTKSGTNAQVSGAYSPVVHRAIGHETSDPTTSVVRTNQSGNTAAQARMQFQAAAIKVLWSRTIVLDLYVRGTSYWASTNL